MEFGSLAVSEIDAGCIGEVPQDTFGQTGRESAFFVTLLTLEIHGGGVDTDVSRSMNVDQNSLALAAVAEFDGVDFVIDFIVFVGPDVEDLDIVGVGNAYVVFPHNNWTSPTDSRVFQCSDFLDRTSFMSLYLDMS